MAKELGPSKIRVNAIAAGVVETKMIDFLSGEEKEVLALYKDLGKLVNSLPDWNAYILTSHPLFEHVYGKNADKRRKLFNANIQCCLYSYMSKKPDKF